MLFVVTLAFASHSAAGDSTVLSYAYLFASYLVAGTGMALGMSRIPDMTRRAKQERSAVVAETVPQGFRYAILIVAPALAALIVAGAPLVHALFPSSLKVDGVHSLRVFAGLLAPWTVVALLVNFLLPAMFALGRGKVLNALALPLLFAHVAATAVASALFGVDGAVGALFVAPACFATILIFVAAESTGRLRGLATELARDSATFVGLSALAFGVGWAVASALSGQLAAPAAAAAVGCAAYGAGLLVVARRQLEVLRGAIGRTAGP
jgi:peptidoglycan biosynthesis protein MviN/MurJ (putative lipid II flippase)